MLGSVFLPVSFSYLARFKTSWVRTKSCTFKLERSMPISRARAHDYEYELE